MTINQLSNTAINQSAQNLMQKLEQLQRSLEALKQALSLTGADLSELSSQPNRSAASKATGSATSSSGVARRPGAYAGPAGFLWKPISDSDGKLAVLLPERKTGSIRRIDILSPDGTRIVEQGRYAGIGNGDREHFRFTRSGAAYQPASILQITHKDGSIERITIQKPAARTEGRAAKAAA